MPPSARAANPAAVDDSAAPAEEEERAGAAAAAAAPPPTEDGEKWIVQWCLDGWHDAREAVSAMLDPRRFTVRPLDPSGPPLAEQCRGAHALIPTTGLVDARCIAAACPTLRLIAQPASAVGNIDLQAARDAGVPVTHAPGHNAAATAEVALMLLLMLLRRAADAPRMIALRQVGKPVGREARGRVIGIVGITGRVGRRVAKGAAALGMRVIGVDSRGRRVEFARAEGGDDEEEAEDGQTGKEEQQQQQHDGNDIGSFKRGLHALLAESDAVSLHIPLCPQTEGCIGREELSIMARRRALLINTARAAVIDREALEEALGPDHDKEDEERTDGDKAPAPPRLAGAGLDVMWREPCDPHDLLLRHPRVIVLPHLGCASEEAYAALAGVLVRNLNAAREDRWEDLEHRVV